LAHYNKNMPVYNYLTVGTGTSTLFGFAAGQTRRAVIIGGAVSIITLPLYLAFIANEEQLRNGIASAFGVDLEAEMRKLEAENLKITGTEVGPVTETIDTKVASIEAAHKDGERR